jgi:hypothetical protein
VSFLSQINLHFKLLIQLVLNSRDLYKNVNSSQFNQILQSVQNFDLDKLSQGMYENFLNIRVRDNYHELVRKQIDYDSIFFLYKCYCWLDFERGKLVHFHR